MLIFVWIWIIKPGNQTSRLMYKECDSVKIVNDCHGYQIGEEGFFVCLWCDTRTFRDGTAADACSPGCRQPDKSSGNYKLKEIICLVWTYVHNNGAVIRGKWQKTRTKPFIIYTKHPRPTGGGGGGGELGPSCFQLTNYVVLRTEHS